jgi:hypothetical protein
MSARLMDIASDLSEGAPSGALFVGANCRPASKTDQRLAAIKAGTLRRPLMATTWED